MLRVAQRRFFPKRPPWEVLGVPRTADAEQVKKSFLEQCKLTKIFDGNFDEKVTNSRNSFQNHSIFSKSSSKILILNQVDAPGY